MRRTELAESQQARKRGERRGPMTQESQKSKGNSRASMKGGGSDMTGSRPEIRDAGAREKG